MKLKLKAFIAFLISLAMPALWLCVMLWVDEGEIPFVVGIILLLQLAGVIFQRRKGRKNRFIANSGIISIVLGIVAFFSLWRGYWFLNISWFVITLFFYLSYFLDTASAFWKALISNRNRRWYQY